MKAVFIDAFVKSYDELRVTDIAAPVPKDREVLVDVKAAGLNFVDLLYARGKHQNNRSLHVPPFVLGLEFAGVVRETTPSSNFKPGDCVFGSTQGSFAEQVCVPGSSLNIIPSGWSFLDAAGLAATAPVSYGALINRAFIKAGEVVLVHAAAGGLGLMAVQIAKGAGCKVIATAGSPDKREVAKRFGADHVIDYNELEWWKKVLEITHGKGVNCVYDPVGKISESLKCCAPFAKLLLIGFAGTEGDIEKIAMNRVLLRQAHIIGYRYGDSARKYPAEVADIVKGTIKMIEEGHIQPTVYEKKYQGLNSIVSAMHDLASRKVWGKAVISLEEPTSKSRI